MTMATHAHFEHGAQLKIDYTPGSALEAGDIVDLGGGLVGVANRAIAANEKDALDVGGGTYAVKKAAGTGVTFAVGAEVYWDTVAETAVATPSANTIPFGICCAAAVTGDDNVKAILNVHANLFDLAAIGVIEAGKAVTADANGKIGLVRLGSAAASASGLLMGVGTTANPAATSTAGANMIEVRAKTTATSGDNRLGYFRYDVGGAGASGDCLRAFTDLTAAADTARGAHISLQAGATGYVTGLGIGVDAQLYVKNEAVAANGTYYAAQSDVYFAGATGSLAAVTKHAIHHFGTSGNATGQATCVNVWAVDATAAADTTKAISSVSLAELPAGTVGIAVLINGTRYYIPAVAATAWN